MNREQSTQSRMAATTATATSVAQGVSSARAQLLPSSLLRSIAVASLLPLSSHSHSPHGLLLPASFTSLASIYLLLVHQVLFVLYSIPVA